jgi:hypothetical protein
MSIMPLPQIQINGTSYSLVDNNKNRGRQMIDKRCNYVMPDGHRCNKPFRDRTGRVRHTTCEEHRVQKSKKSGLVKDRDKTGSPYVQLTNAKLMSDWVQTQMENALVDKVENLIHRIGSIERMVFHYEKNEEKEVSEDEAPQRSTSKDEKYSFLTSGAFKGAVQMEMDDAIRKAITEDDAFKNKVMGNIAKLNGRMTTNIGEMKKIKSEVSPRITALNDKLQRMERLMATLEIQQMELSSLLRKEQKLLKKRMNMRKTRFVHASFTGGEKENEEE